MDAFVATHPIFDRLAKVYGYDLAFRSGFDEFYEIATLQDAKVELRLAGNFAELAGHGKAHVAFSRDLLRRKLPALLPAEELTVGMPADLPAEGPLVEFCRELSEEGYELAIDDFEPGRMDSPYLEFADIVSVDTTAVSQAGQQDICRRLPSRGIRTLAKYVDSAEAFDRALEMGYWYFEGNFFRKPVLQPGKEIATSKLSYMRVLNEVNRPELPYADLEALIKQDVAMTYKLLRFINSAWYSLRSKIESIHHALVLLGPAEVRAWASLLVLREAGQDKPEELFRRSLTRAKVAEGLAPRVSIPCKGPELFLMGMFSLVEALTDVPIARVLENLPLGDDVKAALLKGDGRFSPILEVILSYEMGWWESVTSMAGSLGFDEEILPDLFSESRKWADGALSIL